MENIIGYEGLYEVSNFGNVRNVRRNTLLRFSNNQGYLQVYLYKNGIRAGLKVHRLVAQAFIPNPDNLHQVNHRDEDKTNNIAENLEWCDVSYNINYGHRTENAISTRVENGYADPDFIGFGLDEKEYMKQYNRVYRENNRERYNEWQREYRLKKKNR